MNTAFRLSCLVVAVSLSLFAAAQSTTKPAIPSLGETIEVAIVNVDVFVTDRDGKRVVGLTREDFEIYENGKLQPLSHFAEFRGANVANGTVSVEAGAPAVAEPPPPQRRTIVFFLEPVKLNEFRVAPLVASMRKLVRDTVRPGDAVSLIVFDRTPQLRVSATDDVAVVESAIEEFGRECVGPHSDRIAEVAKEFEALKTFDTRAANLAIRAGVGAVRATNSALADGVAKFSAIRARVEMHRRVAAINSVLHTLAGVDGKKILLLAANRLGEFAGAEFYYATGQRMTGTEHAEFDNKESVRGIISNANAAGVTVYPIFPAGLDQTHVDPDAPEISQPILMNEMAMRNEIAERTGGLTSWGSADIAKLLPSVADDISSYYSIAYRAPSRSQDVSRNIVVKTTDPKLQVRARKEFVEKSPDTRMRDRVVAALYDEQSPSPLAITAQLGTTRDAGLRKRSNAPLKVRIPIQALTLLPQDGKHVGAFSVYLITGGKLGEVSKVTQKTQSFEIAERDLDRAMTSYFTYEFDVFFNNGAERAAVGVLDEVSKTYGLANVRLPQ